MPIPCEEVQATARGDHRDSATIAAHLLGCGECRTAIADFRQMALSARTALALEPSSPRISPPVPGSLRWLPRYALATAAAALTIALIIATKPEPAPILAKPVVIEFPPPVNDNLHFVVHGPAGTQQEVRVPNIHYVLEAVSPDAVIVDTF